MARRLVELAEQGRVSDSEVHAIFNGCEIKTPKGTGIYESGRLRLGGQLHELSADKILDVVWPAPKVQPGLKEKIPASFRKASDAVRQKKKDPVIKPKPKFDSES